jgi:methylated-DNA-[protein]-cysteine S-methyltransferase
MVTDSPVGKLRLVENNGSITAIDFHPFGYADGRPRGEEDEQHPVLLECARQLAAYFAGELTEFDLPLDPFGTPWQRQVWESLRTVGYGHTATYGEIALRLGKTYAASRAVGLANGRNPIPIVIPCHRIIGSNGSLTGYAGGLERKQVLLGIETESLF